jgi:hypothetical protein
MLVASGRANQRGGTIEQRAFLGLLDGKGLDERGGETLRRCNIGN